MTWLKRGVFFLVIIFVLLAGIVSWLLFGLDPNQYKPQIQQLAAKQGIALTLDGDIGWQLWPDIALKLEGVKLAPLLLPDQQLLQVDKVAVGVALMPLLKKRIEAREVLLLGPQINLTVDEKGRGNWTLIKKAMDVQAQQKAKQKKEQPPKLEIPEAEKADGKDLHLALAKLRIEDGRISYKDIAKKNRLQH